MVAADIRLTRISVVAHGVSGFRDSGWVGYLTVTNLQE